MESTEVLCDPLPNMPALHAGSRMISKSSGCRAKPASVSLGAQLFTSWVTLDTLLNFSVLMPFFVKRGHLIVHSLLSYYQDYEEANKKYFAYYLTHVCSRKV